LTVAELKARGVVFEDIRGIKIQNGIANAGGAKDAWFEDSEEKIMAVSQSCEHYRGLAPATVISIKRPQGLDR
jgi:hypothetical protein